MSIRPYILYKQNEKNTLQSVVCDVLKQWGSAWGVDNAECNIDPTELSTAFDDEVDLKPSRDTCQITQIKVNDDLWCIYEIAEIDKKRLASKLLKVSLADLQKQESGIVIDELINRALLKDLNRISRETFGSILKEIKSFYQTIKKQGWNGLKLKIEIKNKELLKFKHFQDQLEKLFVKTGLKRFSKTLNSIYKYLNSYNDEYAIKLKEEMMARLPENGLTDKSLIYYLKKLKGAFSLVLRQFRRKIEEDQKEFTNSKFLLFKRPERISKDESILLNNFLKKYPQFNKYRSLSIKISDIYNFLPMSFPNKR